MKPIDPKIPSRSTHLVKIGPLGALTIILPRMAGHYVIVEEDNGELILRPVDLKADTPLAAARVARSGRGNFCFLPAPDASIPRA
jgi:hypothetical protein